MGLHVDPAVAAKLFALAEESETSASDMADASLRADLAKKLFNAGPTDCFMLSLDHSRRHDLLLFWRPEARGYTSNLLQAGVYSAAEADGLRTRGKSCPVPVVKVVAFMVPEVTVCRSRFDELAGKHKHEEP